MDDEIKKEAPLIEISLKEIEKGMLIYHTKYYCLSVIDEFFKKISHLYKNIFANCAQNILKSYMSNTKSKKPNQKIRNA